MSDQQTTREILTLILDDSDGPTLTSDGRLVFDGLTIQLNPRQAAYVRRMQP